MNPEVLQFVDALKREIRKDMNNYADDVATGQCSSFEAYQKLCGVIQGLALAERHIIDLVEKAKKAHD